jgi:hypothetical protein
MDDQLFVVQPAHAVTCDVDMSGFANGIAGLTIEGHATTPGKVQFLDGTSGYIKVKTGVNIVGTNLAANGQLVANLDGVLATATPLPFDHTAIIEFAGTAAGYLDCTYLDVNLRCTEPANPYVETYLAAYGPVEQATAVNPTTNFIDWGTAPPANDTVVRVKSSGTLPAGMNVNDIYYVYGKSGNTCQLALQSAIAATVVDITDVGTGNLTFYTGHASTSTKTLNVVQDVTADPQWVSPAKAVLADIGPVTYDQQRDRIASTSASTVVLTTTNVDSAQYPLARIWLAERNVAIRSNSTSASQPAINVPHSGCKLACEISNLATWAAAATTFYGYGISGGSGCTVISGTVSGCSSGVYYGTSHVISGTVSGCSNGVNYGTSHVISGTISGCTYGVYSGTSHVISGTVSGCSYGVNSGTSHVISGTVSGCSNGVMEGSCILRNALLQNNTYDLRTTATVVYASRLLSGTQVSRNNQIYTPYLGTNPYTCVHWNPRTAGNVIQAGAIQYWNQGGVGTALAPTAGELTALHTAGWDAAFDPDFLMTATFDTTALPAGNTICPLWVDIPITCVPGQTIRFDVAVQASATTTWTVKPSAKIIDLNVPWGGVGEVLVETIAAVADTNWEVLSVSYTATTAKQLVLRVTGTNTSNAGLYFCWCWRQKMDYPVVGSVLSSDTVDTAAGTYHEATVGEVVSGVNFGAASALAGTYPTTATSQAVQLVTDQGVVLAAAASIRDDATILGQAGTYDFTSAIAAGYASGEAAQLVVDTAFLEANKDEIIIDGTSILAEFGVTGTFDYPTAAEIAAAMWDDTTSPNRILTG